MIDLEEQLAAYGDYLDDAERQIVVLRPTVTATSPGSRPHRGGFAFAAAFVLIVVGVTSALVVLTRGRAGDEAIGEQLGDWVEIDSPGAPVGSPRLERGPDGMLVSPNGRAVAAVASTSHGWIAVGTERLDRKTVGRAWYSEDGATWHAVAHDDRFGADDLDESTGSGGIEFVDVAERDGRIVVVGSVLGNFVTPSVWWTDDLATWRQFKFDVEDGGYPSSIAAGERGFVVGGSRPVDADQAAAAAAWFSPDGET